MSISIVTRICSVDGCDLKPHGQGLCTKHHTRMLRYGNVHTVKRQSNKGIPANQRFDMKHEKREGSDCHWWTANTINSGYGRFDRMLAHRFSYERHNGKIPKGMCVLHECDNPLCVNPDHLFLGTQQDNIDDMVIKQRVNSKLIESDVVEIREMLKDGNGENLIAEKYGVTRSTINKVKLGRTWSHVGKE